MIFVLKKKQLLIGFLCIAIAAFFGVRFFYQPTEITSANASTDWGLSFKENGKTPTGNATPDYLKQYDSYFAGSQHDKVIYLTFDAGFENGNTPAILDALKKHNAKGAFFLVGNYVKENPDLVKRMVDEGHIVGNHTYSHPDMSKISDMESFRKEIVKMEDAYKAATGKEMEKFYRPPQGKYSENNLKNAKELGYKTIFWSLAYVDWYENKQPTHQQAFDKLMPRIHPGAVVLLHSTSKTNAEIMDELLTKWENEGYRFGTLHELCQ